MYTVKKVSEGDFESFLNLPSRIYRKSEIMQKRSDEEALLKGTHTLSKYFSFTAFICYHNDKVVARCAVTIYHGKDEAYLGFFDSENDLQAAKNIIEAAESFARENGIKKLTGPVDASFWIGYRMKSNHFDKKRYFGEPYGLYYYPQMWQDCGFKIAETYVSNIYKKLSPKDESDPRYERAKKYFARNGYSVVSPTKADWDSCIGKIYSLLIDLYSDFPVFSYITESEFREMFDSLKSILDFSMVKLGYKNGEMIGFLISVPDYGNRLYGKIGLLDVIHLLKNRKKCDNYILLYLGVVEKSLGFGMVLSQSAFEELRIKRASSIGALIKKGKVSEKYIDDIIIDQREYLLFEKEI